MNTSVVILDPTVALTLRLALALLFAVGAVHKARSFQAFVSTTAAYELIPGHLVRTFCSALVMAEAAVGVGFLLPALHTSTTLAALALLTLYTTAVATNLVRGIREIDCGCGASDHAQHLHPLLLIRNALLMAAAALTASPVHARELVWFDVVSILGAVLCAAFLWNSGSRLLAVHTSTTSIK